MDDNAAYRAFFDKLKADEVYKGLLLTRSTDLPPFHLDVLFTLIKQYSGARTTIVLQERKDIQKKLQDAWKAKSFEDILRVLHPLQHKKVKEEEAKQIEKRVEKAWNTPYQGLLHNLLFKNINAMKGNGPYQNICAIVQSSGTGKSRMVDEQAKLVYTLPINIRTKEGVYVAYPAPDDALREYLVHEAESEQDYLVFFKHLFSHAIKALEQITTHSGMSRADLATVWHEHIRDTEMRRKFYREVVGMCRAVSSPELESIDSNAVLEVLRDLIMKLDECSINSAEKVKIVIYIDEAHELNRLADGQLKFAIICSVLASFAKEPLFVLLLSTQSSLPLLAPPGIAAPSERAQRASSVLPAPITEVPFDCAPGIQVEPGKLHLNQLWNIEYLTRWGRPLWWTMFKALNPELGPQTRDEIIEFARMKILAHHSIYCGLSDITLAAQVAVVDVLLALDFEPRRDSFRLQTDMVESHMRIAYSVPQHREYLRSGYSSEPVLAEAAVQQIVYFKTEAQVKRTLGVMVQLLEGAMDNTLIDFGQRGEVVMRLLLMDAYMEAVIEEHLFPLIFSRGCQLVTFIAQLFSPVASNAILTSRPDNRQGVSGGFRSAFRNSIVRFTHFVKATDECAVTTAALFAAFARGMAFICHPTQKSVDIVIPVLYDKSEPLQESNMTALLVQVKRRNKAGSPLTYQFSHKDIGLFPQNDESKRPYITFVAELGVDHRREPVDVGPSKDRRLRRGDKHPRYHVTTYRCSNVVYKAAEGLDDKLESLLAASKFLSNHPREADSVSATWKMKPVWKIGESSFHWVSDPRLNPAIAHKRESDSKGTQMKQTEMKDSEMKEDEMVEDDTEEGETEEDDTEEDEKEENEMEVDNS